jgi:ABC transporter with metal-binding/Fe-S-binding domain ATP-binding protein
MDLAALVSGGKDSMLAMYRMHKMGHNIRFLLTMNPVSQESYMFHHQNIWVVNLISETTKIPLIMDETHGRKEEELSDLKSLLQKVEGGVDGIISGALASNYQKSRIELLCDELSLKSFSPLWRIDSVQMWEDLFVEGFQVMVTAVAAEGLKEKWLGKVIDESTFHELKKLSEKHRFHLGFEGGEAETLVLDMPLYEKKIVVLESDVEWQGTHGSLIIKDAVLEDK